MSGCWGGVCGFCGWRRCVCGYSSLADILRRWNEWRDGVVFGIPLDKPRDQRGGAIGVLCFHGGAGADGGVCEFSGVEESGGDGAGAVGAGVGAGEWVGDEVCAARGVAAVGGWSG